MSEGPDSKRLSLGVLGIPLRAPRATLVVVLALTVALGLAGRTLTVDGSPASLLRDGDRERIYSERVQRELGEEEAIVVGVFAEDVLSPATLAKIDRLTARLSQVDGVAAVVGPTTLPHMVAHEGGMRRVPLMHTLPETPEEAAALRAAVLDHPLARTIVAADGRAAAISIRLRTASAHAVSPAELDARVRTLVAQLGGPESWTIAGPAAVAAHAAREMDRERVTLTAAALLVIVLVALVALRSGRGVVLPLVTVLIGLVWTAGVMVLRGDSITISTLVLPPLLVLIGFTYPLRLLSRYEMERDSKQSAPEAVAAAVGWVGMPLAVSALATLVGVSALLFSAMPAVRAFGLYAGIGVACMLVASLTVVPAVLVLMPARRAQGRANPGATSMAQWLERIGAQTMRHRKALVFAGVVLAAASVWGIGRIQAGTAYIELFDPGSAVRHNDERIADHLAGTQVVTIVVDGGLRGSIGRLDTIRALRDLQGFIDRQPGVDASVSLLDYLDLIRGAQGAAGRHALPDTQDDLDALLRIDPASLYEAVNADFSRARIVVRTTLYAPAALGKFLERVQAFASPKLLHRGLGKRALFPRGVTVRPTGSGVLLGRAAEALAAEQITGVLRVAGALVLLVSLVFLSVRVGFFAVLLNAAAVVALFGIMGWAGVSVNAVTGTLAALVLGVSVGQTVQCVSGCSAETRPGSRERDTLARVIRSVGAPIGFSMLGLAVGFLVFALSGFPPVRWFGYLGSATMSVALVANLVLLSTRVLTIRVVTLSDVLVMKLGPLEEIPLFDGLRPFQAKIVVLTGHLAAAARGELITRRGETSADLYVLLSGRAEVHHGAGRQSLGSLTRGDVIGEMGFVREEPRSADVVAAEDTEYLVLDGSFLARLRRQYPRLAATVLFNLTRILSDRLEHTSAELAALKEGQS